MKSINRTIIIAGGLALSGIIVAGLAIASQSGHFGQRTHHQGFHAKKLDTNGDGMLTREEMLAKNAARFTSLDKDGSGSITADEFSANLAQMFDRLDANGDGMLAPDELPGGRTGCMMVTITTDTRTNIATFTVTKPG